MTEVQFITDAQGLKTGVILPITDYEDILEEFYFAHAAREAKDEPTRDLDEILAEMRRDGEIDV